MFFRKKRPEKTKLQKWLDAADSAYAKAFLEKSIRSFEPYASRKVLSGLMEEIRLGETAYAGLERYKHVKWSRLPDREPPTFRKEVSYDHIKVAHGIVAPVGDDYVEEWELTFGNGEPQVTKIRRLNHWEVT